MTGATVAGVLAPGPSGKTRALSRLSFRTPSLALSHFKKHWAEFGFQNALQYAKAAERFVTSTGTGIVRYINAQGKILIYNKATNELATRTGSIILHLL